MSNVAKEKLKIYDAVLSSPGMDENVKIVLQLSRKRVLLLTRLIEHGLTSSQENPDAITNLIAKEELQEFQTVVEEILKKGGLTEFNEKLKSL